MLSAADDHIAVDFATLRNLSSELESILRGLNQALGALYERVEKVVLTWEGEARDTFVGELDKWDLSAQDLEALQAWLHEVVVSGHINYAAAHKAVLRGWGVS
ncbi:WXG100 family type VII secretion target [Streptomyces sp. NPDC006197]|uniref:WXG100 family type VII secretion target n=1 Tax=Streptomyces sp. NPDC006197 TaxID=3156685 RepID=UPI0033B45E92